VGLYRASHEYLLLERFGQVRDWMPSLEGDVIEMQSGRFEPVNRTPLLW
jgi:hypothetical protein